MKKISKGLLFAVPLLFFAVFLLKNRPLEVSNDFESLMGKGSAAWQYVETPEDKQNLHFFRTLYEKNISLLSSKSKEELIPRTLHIIWLGPQEFPKSSLKNVASWVRNHPDWTIKFWTDIDREAPHPSMQRVLVEETHLPHLLSCYYKSDNFGEKSEILRYEILLKEGGLYVDHDVLSLEKMDLLHSAYDFYCQLSEISRPILSSSISPSTHLIAAKADHPILKSAISWLNKNFDALETFYPGTDPSSVVSRVKHRSFSALNEGIFNEIDRETRSDIVFPAKMTFAKHTHDSTWVEHRTKWEKKWDKELDHLAAKSSQTEWILLILLLFTAPVLLLFRKKKSGILLFLMLSCAAHANEQGENFDELMGKKTEHWSWVQKPEDLRFLSLCKALFEKNSSELLAAHSQAKIPHVIHFIWLGPKPFPPESVENVRTWLTQNPDWTVKFWTDSDRPTPCKGMQKMRVQDFAFSRLGKSFYESQNWGEKSDILRYEILFKEGGVYVDHDANCLKPFDKLHDAYDFYCGMETPHEPFVGRNVTCGNGVIGSRPGHPAIKKVLELIGERWKRLGKKYRGKDLYSRTEVVMQRTYIALTEALKDSIDQEGNVDIVLPAAYFFAKSGLPSLYSKHFYATAWSDQKIKKSDWEKGAQKKLDKIKQKSKNLQLLVALMFGVNLLIIFRILTEKKSWIKSS